MSKILTTKLFVPTLGSDYIKRDVILDELGRNNDKPFILVSAPAGYGKSTLIADWLHDGDMDYGWISLSQRDNQFIGFLEYCIAAIQTKVPDFAKDLKNNLYSPQLIPANELERMLINEFQYMDRKFYLTLDDFHLINNPDIHHFIETLIGFPSPLLSLIIITRSDPPLPITTYRIHNKIHEVRLNDLRFSEKETAKYLSKKFNIPEKMYSTLTQLTEGWISGLKMYTLSNNIDVDKIGMSSNKASENRSLLKDLVIDILQDLNDDFRRCLMVSSILKRFSAELCGELCGNDGQAFINRLRKSNLFLIPLDNRNNWYRFHHLFTDLLQTEMYENLRPDEIENKHIVAAGWYQRNNEPELAVLHYLTSGELSLAIDIFNKERTQYTNSGDWIALERIFEYFPKERIETEPVLLLAKCWLLLYHGKTIEMFDLVDRGKELFNRKEISLYGEMLSLQAYRVYHIEQDLQKCLDLTEQALELMFSTDSFYAIGYAWIFKGGALQALGRTSLAKKEIYQEIDKGDAPHTPALLLILNFIHWLEGDSHDLKKSSHQLLDHGEKRDNPEALANGYIFCGVYEYIIGNYKAAAELLEKAYSQRFNTVGILTFFGESALVNTHHILDSNEDLQVCMLRMEKLVNVKGGEILRSYWSAHEAEIKLLYGDKNFTKKWLKSNLELPILPITNFSDPNINLIRILLNEGTHESLSRAKDLIARLEAILIKTNNNHFLFFLNLSKALLAYLYNQREPAIEILENTLDEYEHSEMVTVIVEFGQLMVPLLQESDKIRDRELVVKALNILTSETQMSSEKIKSQFTPREIQLVQLLSRQMTNKEIANQLYIAEKTVKRHSNNLYKKLKVKNRREAVVKAEVLELL